MLYQVLSPCWSALKACVVLASSRALIPAICKARLFFGHPGQKWHVSTAAIKS
jgi:hypothetical protein